MSRILGLFLALLVSLTTLSGTALAENPPENVDTATTTENLTSEAIRDMVARLSDAEVRALLLERLDAVAAEEGQSDSPETIIEGLDALWSAFKSPIIMAVQRIPVLVQRQSAAVAAFVKAQGPDMVSLVGFTLLALALGFAAEFAVNMITRRWQGVPLKGQEASLWEAISYLFRRFCREILGLVVFIFVARAALQVNLTAQQLAIAGPFLTLLVWGPRLGAAAARFILAPSRPDLRLVNVPDNWASFLYWHQIGLIILAGFTVFSLQFNKVAGVPMGDTSLGFWLNLAVHIYIIWIVWTAREGLVAMMRGTDPDITPFDAKVAQAYPWFAIIVSISMWAIVVILAGFKQYELLRHAPNYVSMFWLLLAPAIDTVIRGLVRHLQPPMIGEGTIAELAYQSTKRSFIRIGRLIAIAVVLLIVANAWDINLVNLASAGVGEKFASNLVEFSITVAIGFMIYELVSLWFNRRLAREHTEIGFDPEDLMEGGGDGGGAGGSRLATVLPLMRMTAQAATVVVFGLLAIAALGVNIAPLLAGAGIVGLAIGFGAQKLVADVVSGVFFLIDDAFRTGEYVDVGGTMGTVEKISIRSMQLRHHRGSLHTVPYGEIPKLTNFSRDWVIMKLRFTVPFETDPNQIKKIFKKIGQEMMEIPEFAEDFLQPFKSQGVFDFDDVGMVVRGKFMAKPGKQFVLRKEIFTRVKKAFAENDIEFARREVRVAIPGLENAEDLDEEQREAVMGAAAEAVNQAVEQPDQSADKPKPGD